MSTINTTESWRLCPTKPDNNSFFHSAFGMRNKEDGIFSDNDAQFRRMRWATFLTYFPSKSMPPRLRDILRKCFTTNDKYKHASIDDKDNFMKYVSNIVAAERNVTIEEISVLATLENIKITVFSNKSLDAVITIKPNPDILGSYPNVENPKEEVILCLEGDVFSKLKPVKDYTPTSNGINVKK